MKNTNNNQQKNLKGIQSTGISLLFALLVFLASIPVNLIAERLNIKWDMTPNKLYTLTDTSKKVLNQLNNPVEIYLFFDIEEIKNSNSDAIDLYNTLKQYDSFEKVSIINADPYTEEGIKNKTTLEQTIDLSADTTSGNIYYYAVIKSGAIARKVRIIYTEQTFDEATGTYSTLPVAFASENSITGNIKYVDKYATLNYQPKVYFLTGHGEKSINTEISSIISQIELDSYKTDVLNLTQTDTVPQDAQVIIIAAPQTDISIDEKKKLNEFLDNGGNIIFLMAPNAKEMAYTNIEDILSEYAIGMNYDIVTESNTANLLNEDDKYTFFGEYVPAVETDLIDLTSLLQIEPCFPNTRSFYLKSTDNISSLKYAKIATSYDTAISEPLGGTNPDADPIEGTQTLALYSVDTDRNNSKVIVFGTTDFLNDEYMEISASPDNTEISEEDMQKMYKSSLSQLFLTSITWMHDNEIDMSIPVKQKVEDYMNFGDENSSPEEIENSAQGVIILFAFIPVVIAGIGILVWSRRRVS